MRAKQQYYTNLIWKIIPILPHIGFNVENIKYKGFNICCFDHEGGDRIRELWKPYYQYSQGIIFVVDSADVARIMEAKSELLKLLKIDELHDSVLLIFANKQDFPNAMLPNEIARVFQLDEIKDRPWKIQGMSAQTGDGIYEGLDWLDEQIMKMN